MSDVPAYAARTFLKALREAVRAGKHVDSQSLSGLLNQAESLLKSQTALLKADSAEAPDPILHERDMADFSHILSVLLASSAEEGLHRRCLSLLCSLGDAGEAYAVGYLLSGQTRPEVLVGMVQSIPAESRLLLLNALLRRPRGGSGEALIPSLRRNLAETINEEPEEGLVLLDALGKRGLEPACAVQHAMLGSRFGLWLEELLRMELSAEQIGYMANAVRVLRAHGLAVLLVRHWPRMRKEELVPLIRCFAACAEPQDAKIRELLIAATGHRLQEVRDAAIEAQVALGLPEADEPLAANLAGSAEGGVSPALCALLLRLDSDTFKNVFKRLDSSVRPALVSRLAVVLASFDQQRLLEVLKGLDIPATRTATAEEAAAHVRGFVSVNANVEFTPFHTPSMPRTEPPADGDEADAGGLLANVRSFFSREKKQEEGPHPLSAIGDGEQVSGQQFGPGSIARLQLKNVTFKECTFSGVDISYCAMNGVRFEKCRLHGVRFTESRFNAVTFKDCELALMPADTCLLQDVTFDGSLLETVDFGESRLTGCDFRNATLRSVRLWGSWWRRSRFRNSIAEYTDFGCVAMRDVVLDGSLFGDCMFVRADLRSLTAHGTVFSGCAAPMSRAQGLVTDSPFLLDMAELWRTDAFLAIAEDTADRAMPPASAALYLLLQRWLQMADGERRAVRMLVQNRRRLDWCRAKLGRHGDIVSILPLLLQSAVIPAPSGRGAAASATRTGVPCRIAGYVPHRGALDAMERRIGAPFLPAEDMNLIVEAVYFSGAAGSIAQTAEAPLDIWVIHTAEDGAEGLLESFREKLDAIARWARVDLRLSIRFHVVSAESIRTNTFGFNGSEGDAEAGVSQSMLLKAELYRFMVLLAGRMPAWWCTPAGIDDAEYVRRLPYLGQGLLPTPPVDLGPLENIPKEALLGTLFWHIARALSVPFLSLLAFGQLEAAVAGQTSLAGEGGAAGEQASMVDLICNRIKRNLHNGFCGVWHADPLAVPLRDLYAFYQKEGRLDVLDLIRQAFLRKCGYATGVSTATIRSADTLHLGAEFLEFFLPFSEDAVGRKLADPVMQGDDSLPTLLEMSELGERLNGYLLATYVRVSGLLGLKADHASEGRAPDFASMEIPAESGLSARDLTMAGRKIFAWLEPRPYKIMRLPFIEPPYGFIESLEFQCEMSPALPPVWSVQARLPKLAGRKAAREMLRSEKSPAKLFCWLIANEYWQPGVLVTGSNLAPNVSIGDVQGALEALYELCTPASFERPWGDYLMGETLVRAVALVNYGTPKDVRKPETASLVYLTSWGELFCLPDMPGAAALSDRPVQAVRALAHCPAGEGARLTIFLPKRFSFDLEREIIF
ncbi:pentapeptide repeat-containing protein [Desulfovibrio mangrovi]|uniref:pentapeptide repeat-containing protein n=1 Tax=Desulfovibrio mangrovi TaxID=2976983 RepID=UPI002245D327|nr:pentapeptide repeat-containing protein [Desulfovibrio mangrovi]UZP68998.1 pentapeptide repeat-containing protein [Desulfovibrio mangrovi]